MSKKEVLDYLSNQYRSLKYKLVVIPGLVYLLFVIVRAQLYTYKIDNCNYDIIHCHVYDVVRVIKSPGFGVSITYSYGDKLYDKYETEPNIFKNNFRYFLKGRNVPLLICKSDPEYHEILLLPKDFEERNLKYPDSLSIYLEYLK